MFLCSSASRLAIKEFIWMLQWRVSISTVLRSDGWVSVISGCVCLHSIIGTCFTNIKHNTCLKTLLFLPIKLLLITGACRYAHQWNSIKLHFPCKQLHWNLWNFGLGLISCLFSINSFLTYYGPHKRVSGLGFKSKMKVFFYTCKNTV